MKIEELKQKDIVSYLASRGLSPQKSNGKTAVFLSPVGKEHTASLMVDTSKNRYTNYSTGGFGDVLDLIQEIDNCDFKTACATLSGGEFNHIEEYTPPKVVKKSGVEIHSVDIITDTGLLEYFIEKRKIDETVLKTYCSEVSFSFPYSLKDNTRVYRAIGFPTSMKSWELRSTFIKIASPPKSFSRMKGFSSEKYLLFEGWVDYLSYLTHHNVLTPKYDAFVLNGVHQLRLIKPFLENKDVYVYVDSDEAGDGVIEEMDNCNPIDMRFSFPFFNDYNEFLKSL